MASASRESYQYRHPTLPVMSGLVSTLIPLDGFSADDFFKQFDPVGDYREIGFHETLRRNQQAILDAIKRLIPEFVDENAMLCKDQPNNYVTTDFFRQFEKGYFSGTIRVSKEVRHLLGLKMPIGQRTLSEAEQAKEAKIISIEDAFKGREGMSISGGYYLGQGEVNGLVYGFINPYGLENCRPLECRVISNLINAFCHGTELTYESIVGEAGTTSMHRFGGGGFMGNVSVHTLAELTEADKHIGEFMQWLVDNQEGIRVMRRSAILAAYQADAKERLLRSGYSPDTILIKDLASAAERYASTAIEGFSQLKPPVNNRMNYLVR